MSLSFQRKFQHAAANYDNQCEPDPEISDEAFQSACEDVALQMRNRTDDLAELISVAAEVAPALGQL